jgi:lysophospholipase L1-like esterase
MLANSNKKLQSGEDFMIVYMGGSITQAGTTKTNDYDQPGYRDYITQWFREKHPESKITDHHAAIAGTGSEFGVLRLSQHVLIHNPDLVFVEFAVNDGGDGVSIMRCMEGVVRQIWTQNPMTDIFFLYALSHDMFYSFAKETVPVSIAAHEQVAAHYGIPSANFALALYNRHISDDLPWADYFLDHAHPTNLGNQCYAKLAADALEGLLKGTPAPHRLPDPIASRFISKAGMTYLKDIPHAGWDEEEVGYWGYDLTWIASDKPGNALSFAFKGNLIGVFWNVAADTGDVLYSIDGGPWRRSPTWDGWVNLAPQRINYKIWDAFLPDGEHQLELRIAEDRMWKKCEGGNIRLIAFLTGQYGLASY